jgi:hypothetical protein
LTATLQERIDLSYAARIAIGEDVSWAENARDQITAFTDLVIPAASLPRAWIGPPDPALDAHLAELRELITQHG